MRATRSGITLKLICVRLLGFAALLTIASSVQARPDRNAFLNDRARSPIEVVRQVKRDPEVLDRYMRHFGWSKQGVLAYLSSLQPARLAKTGTYRVYSVPPDGSIKMHYREFRAGMPVYADLTGAPVMIAKCGNPLTPGSGAPISLNKTNAELVDRPASERLLGVGDVDLASDELLAYAPGTPPPPVEEVLSKEQTRVTINPGGGGLFNPWGLGLLGFLFIDNDSDSHITPVPEPAALAALGLGVIGLLRLQKRPRR